MIGGEPIAAEARQKDGRQVHELAAALLTRPGVLEAGDSIQVEMDPFAILQASVAVVATGFVLGALVADGAGGGDGAVFLAGLAGGVVAAWGARLGSADPAVSVILPLKSRTEVPQ